MIQIRNTANDGFGSRMNESADKSDTDHITIVSEIDTVSLRVSRRTAVFKMAANIFLSRAKEQSVHWKVPFVYDLKNQIN